jgi:hypothetical protein
MYFTNPRSIQQNNKLYTQNTNKTRPNIGMGMTITRSNAKPSTNTIVQPSAPKPKPNSDITWGKSYWFFFHTMAEKIKPEYYLQYRNHLFDIVKEVCNNLPCPDCSQHAVSYITKINVNALTTKEDFIMCLFEFHNSVNKRKHFPVFTVDELLQKYSKANFKNIINYFMHYYRMEYRSIRMIADTMHRQRSATRIFNWLQTNNNLFIL